MKNTLKLLSIILLLSSCRTDAIKDESLDKNIAVTSDTNSSAHKFVSVPEARSEKEIVDWQEIHFADLTILLEEIEMNWADKHLSNDERAYSTNSDTAYFDLLPGDGFLDKVIKIKQSEYDNIELYEMIIFKMAMNSKRTIEVPVCVIANWKTFESKWSQIHFDNDEPKFRSNENRTDAIVNFTVEEFKAAVKEHCGIEWYNEIKNIKSKDKLPSEPFTSEYIFKIVARNSKTGDRIEKFIVFNSPTSC